MDFELVRAGYMYRQSSILRRWKKNWFTLSRDGMFRYFSSPDEHMSEEAFEIASDLQAIHTGDQIGEVTLPEGLGRSCLLELVLDDSRLLMCAESPDDRSAWQIAIEQARDAPLPPPYYSVAPPPCPVAPPPPYSETHPPQQTVVYAYPDTFSSDAFGSPPPYVVQTSVGGNGQPAQQVVYVHDQRRGRGVDGGDLAVGMLAGATMGTLMMGPLLWW